MLRPEDCSEGSEDDPDIAPGRSRPIPILGHEEPQLGSGNIVYRRSSLSADAEGQEGHQDRQRQQGNTNGVSNTGGTGGGGIGGTGGARNGYTSADVPPGVSALSERGDGFGLDGSEAKDWAGGDQAVGPELFMGEMEGIDGEQLVNNVEDNDAAYGRYGTGGVYGDEDAGYYSNRNYHAEVGRTESGTPREAGAISIGGDGNLPERKRYNMKIREDGRSAWQDVALGRSVDNSDDAMEDEMHRRSELRSTTKYKNKLQGSNSFGAIRDTGARGGGGGGGGGGASKGGGRRKGDKQATAGGAQKRGGRAESFDGTPAHKAPLAADSQRSRGGKKGNKRNKQHSEAPWKKQWPEGETASVRKKGPRQRTPDWKKSAAQKRDGRHCANAFTAAARPDEDIWGGRSPPKESRVDGHAWAKGAGAGGVQSPPQTDDDAGGTCSIDDTHAPQEAEPNGILTRILKKANQPSDEQVREAREALRNPVKHQGGKQVLLSGLSLRKPNNLIILLDDAAQALEQYLLGRWQPDGGTKSGRVGTLTGVTKGVPSWVTAWSPYLKVVDLSRNDLEGIEGILKVKRPRVPATLASDEGQDTDDGVREPKEGDVPCTGGDTNLQGETPNMQPIYPLKGLEVLRLNRNLLHALPRDMHVALPMIQRLELYNNKIEYLHLPPGRLEKLLHLNIGYNNLQALPSDVCTVMPNLETLLLPNNLLEWLPPDVVALERLKRLDVSQNPLTSPPVEVAARGVESVKRFFRDIESRDRKAGKDVEVPNEVKIVFLGHTGVGKSKLIEMLSVDVQPPPETEAPLREDPTPTRSKNLVPTTPILLADVHSMPVSYRDMARGSISRGDASAASSMRDAAVKNSGTPLTSTEAGAASLPSPAVAAGGHGWNSWEAGTGPGSAWGGDGDRSSPNPNGHEDLKVGISTWKPTPSFRASRKKLSPEDCVDIRDRLELGRSLSGESGKDSPTMKLWNFEGSQDFHAVHGMFFSRRALYTIAFDLRHVDKDDIYKRVQFWVDCVQTRVPGASILLVGTSPEDMSPEKAREQCQRVLDELDDIEKCIMDDINKLDDGHPSKLLGLPGNRPKIEREVCYVILSNEQGLSAFRDQVRRIAEDTKRFPPARLPPAWREAECLIKLRRSQGHSIMRVDDILGSLKDAGDGAGQGWEDLRTATVSTLEWLNDTSEVVYFNKEGLDEFVILHPLQLIKAINMVVRGDLTDKLKDMVHLGPRGERALPLAEKNATTTPGSAAPATKTPPGLLPPAPALSSCPSEYPPLTQAKSIKPQSVATKIPKPPSQSMKSRTVTGVGDAGCGRRRGGSKRSTTRKRSRRQSRELAEQDAVGASVPSGTMGGVSGVGAVADEPSRPVVNRCSPSPSRPSSANCESSTVPRQPQSLTPNSPSAMPKNAPKVTCAEPGFTSSSSTPSAGGAAAAAAEREPPIMHTFPKPGTAMAAGAAAAAAASTANAVSQAPRPATATAAATPPARAPAPAVAAVGKPSYAELVRKGSATRTVSDTSNDRGAQRQYLRQLDGAKVAAASGIVSPSRAASARPRLTPEDVRELNAGFVSRRVLDALLEPLAEYRWDRDARDFLVRLLQESCVLVECTADQAIGAKSAAGAAPAAAASHSAGQKVLARDGRGVLAVPTPEVAVSRSMSFDTGLERAKRKKEGTKYFIPCVLEDEAFDWKFTRVHNVHCGRRWRFQRFVPPSLMSALLSRFYGMAKRGSVLLGSGSIYLKVLLTSPREDEPTNAEYFLKMHRGAQGAHDFYSFQKAPQLELWAQADVVFREELMRSLKTFVDVVDRTLEEFPGLLVARFIPCPGCMERKPFDPSEWNEFYLEHVEEFRSKTADLTRCSNNCELIDNQKRLMFAGELPQDAKAKESWLDSKWTSNFPELGAALDDNSGTRSPGFGVPLVRPLYPSVCPIGVYDCEAQCARYQATAFVVDATRGLLLTAAHTFMKPKPRAQADSCQGCSTGREWMHEDLCSDETCVILVAMLWPPYVDDTRWEYVAEAVQHAMDFRVKIYDDIGWTPDHPVLLRIQRRFKPISTTVTHGLVFEGLTDRWKDSPGRDGAQAGPALCELKLGQSRAMRHRPAEGAEHLTVDHQALLDGRRLHSTRKDVTMAMSVYPEELVTLVAFPQHMPPARSSICVTHGPVARNIASQDVIEVMLSNHDGASGGPVVDRWGEVVGILSQGSTVSAYVMGISSAKTLLEAQPPYTQQIYSLKPLDERPLLTIPRRQHAFAPDARVGGFGACAFNIFSSGASGT